MPRKTPWCAALGLRLSRRTPVRPQCEPLEDRTLPAASPTFHFDFGLPGSPVARGYTGVNLETYNAANGYGWGNTFGLSGMDRLSGDPLTCDLQRGQNNAFLVDLPNGSYAVTFILGDWFRLRDKIELRAEGKVLATNITTQQGEVQRRTFTVAVNDGRLNLRLMDKGGTSPTWAIYGLDVVPTGGP